MLLRLFLLVIDDVVGAAHIAGHDAGGGGAGVHIVHDDKMSRFQTHVGVNMQKLMLATPAEMLSLLNKTNAFAVIEDPSKVAGVTWNTKGDLGSLLGNIVLSLTICLGCTLGFMYLRKLFPLIYQNNAIEGFSPAKLPPVRFGWARATLGASLEENVKAIGLDNAMLIEFNVLCMKMCAIIGIPMNLIMGPLNMWAGGWAANNRLNYWSMANIAHGSWLFWAHALAVWCVVLGVHVSVFSAMDQFILHRYAWLRKMNDLRARTVMVEGIPPDYRSDEEFRRLFSTMFENMVESVYVVKCTPTLFPLWTKLREKMACLREAEARWEHEHKDPSKRPVDPVKGDLIDYYDREVAAVTKLVEHERDIIEVESQQVGGVNTSSGFVTFTKRRYAQLALDVRYSQNQDVYVVSTPPLPEDIIWRDLQVLDASKATWTTIGYLLLVALFVAYLPLVVLITNIANLINLGPFQPLWHSVAPSLGLTIMVSFLPSIMMWIFDSCFTLKAQAWSQHCLQRWYYAFQVVFVLLITCICTNVVTFAKQLIQDPTGFSSLAAASMPFATHFYMNYIVTQWYSHFMQLLRYVQLAKFWTFSVIYKPDEARSMSEPEDQDYYGIGSRSARLGINMAIGIVFSSLCPLILPIVFVNFAFGRLIYGYLIGFAETKKPDLGGAFWVQELKHLYLAILIYVVLMVGVLTAWGQTAGPPGIACLSLSLVAYSYTKFQRRYMWKKLPFFDCDEKHYEKTHTVDLASETTEHRYVHPALVPSAWNMPASRV